MASSTSIPTFAIVGQPNNGKTTVIATLAEEDSAEIDSRAGTTRRCHLYPVVVDQQEIIRFVDTPGFEEAAAAREWFTENARKYANPAAAFVQEHAPSGRFPRECEILKPIAEGAALIYVVDASIPVRQPLREEIELIRMLHNPRIAVINSKGPDEAMLDDWRKELRQAAMPPRTFNGHRATFTDRLELLHSMKGVIEEWKPMLDHAITAFRADWQRRLNKSADLIADLLSDAMSMTARCPVGERRDAKEAAAYAAEEFCKRLVEREERFREEIREIFKHKRSDRDWLLPENSVLQDDLFSERVWRLFGLSRTQLTTISLILGATIGGIVDAHVGGASWGLGALIGAGAGALVGYFGAAQGVSIDLPGFRIAGIRVPGFKARSGSDHAEARGRAASNLPWIILDRAFCYVQLASSWAHGRQERLVQVDLSSPVLREIATTNWTNANRSVITNFLKHAYPKKDSPKRERAYTDMRRVFRSLLDRMTGFDQNSDPLGNLDPLSHDTPGRSAHMDCRPREKGML